MERVLSKTSAVRKIPVSLSLQAVDGGFELSASIDRLSPVSCYYPLEHQQAQKPPHENIIRQLSKLGDTIYESVEVLVPDDFDLFIPNSTLSEMRRIIVERLSAQKWLSNETIEANVSPVKTPAYKYPYLYNISNHLSRGFYAVDDMTAYELKGGDGPLMQCRHCIRYSLGYCVKRGGKRPEWREPLSLVLGDGRRFRLEFDCAQCQMNVYAP